MSKKITKALSFAHLIGLGAARADDSDDDSAKRAEDDERKQREDESDKDYAKRMKALDDKDDEDDEDDKDGDKDGAGADDDQDGDSDKEKAARVGERARCAAIFACPAAAARPDMAAHMAFQTDMSASAAIGMLNAFSAGAAPAASAGRQSLSTRMAGVKPANVGTGDAAAPTGSQSAAAQIIAAGKLRRGEA